jgi:hypothetical protein
MLRDDRERNFENALARNLQATAQARPTAAAPTNAPASVPASNSVAAGACPDTETLAAYHERTLGPEEMISARQHTAACGRCQEILARLEATDEVPLEADREDLQPQGVVAVPHMPVVHAARASENPAIHEALAKSNFPVETPRRAANWRWLVPAAALAAAVLIWVALHESNSKTFQLAKNQPQPAPELSPAPASPPIDAAKQKSSNDSQPPSIAPNAPRESKARPSAPAAKSATPGTNLQPGDSVASAKRAQQQTRATAPSPAQRKQLAPDTALPSSAPGTPGPFDAATDRITVAPSAPRELDRVATVGAAATAPQKSPAARGGALALREASNQETKPMVVSSPDGAAIWRLGPSGLIQFSEDSGTHWTIQKTGIVAALLAGSAPSREVCWLAGRNGVIVRTTDAGAHWQKLSSPTSVDITTVFAVDAQQAIVTTPTNQSYKTIDGGETWTPHPK